ncbi:TPA: hypothetical protein HA249_04970 [Candidatus Woesearchaeota archaeon]|nr:hypothetical protein [Candidatus Woesearchaeota archaeon]HIH46837.1 hypothetical protein [Candidatus Woesearchaeota archaeon]
MPKGVIGTIRQEKAGVSGLIKSELGPSFRFYNFPGKVDPGTKVDFKLYNDKELRGMSGKYGIVRELNGIKLSKPRK